MFKRKNKYSYQNQSPDPEGGGKEEEIKGKDGWMDVGSTHHNQGLHSAVLVDSGLYNAMALCCCFLNKSQ